MLIIFNTISKQNFLSILAYSPYHRAQYAMLRISGAVSGWPGIYWIYCVHCLPGRQALRGRWEFI